MERSAPRAWLTPRAQRELTEAVRWIAQEQPAAARALRDAVLGAAERIGRHPESGVVREDLAPLPVRFVALPRFRYVIVYEARPQERPVILRIVHGAMDLPEVLGRRS